MRIGEEKARYRHLQLSPSFPQTRETSLYLPSINPILIIALDTRVNYDQRTLRLICLVISEDKGQFFLYISFAPTCVYLSACQ
jgi:hypothetical protein